MKDDREVIEAITLCRRLVHERRLFFDNYGILNSDGRKLLNRIVRIVVKKVPMLRGVAVKARREPTFENVLKLLDLLEDFGRVVPRP